MIINTKRVKTHTRYTVITAILLYASPCIKIERWSDKNIILQHYQTIIFLGKLTTFKHVGTESEIVLISDHSFIAMSPY